MKNENNYDETIRELYKAGYFQNRIMEIVNNPEPVDNAAYKLSAAQRLSVEDIFDLAQLYAMGKDVPRNYRFSAELLKIAADKGHALSMFMLTRFKMYGYLGGQHDAEELFNDYKKAYEAGWKPSAEMAAHMALMCDDVENAIKYYRVSGDDGNVESVLQFMVLVQVRYMLEGKDWEWRNNKAMETMLSLPKDNVFVLQFLGETYNDGLFGEPVDYNKSWEYYSRAANAQDYSDELNNIFHLAYPFTSLGLGWSYDFPLPQEPLKGSGEAMYYLAVMILKGQHGDPVKDHEQAMKLLEGAVERQFLNAILLQNAMNSNADEEEIKRLLDGNYNHKEEEWFVSECLALGNFYSASWNQLNLNVEDAAEHTENVENQES